MTALERVRRTALEPAGNTADQGILAPVDRAIEHCGEIWLATGADAYYLVCGHTTIRIVRNDRTDDIAGVLRRGKVNRFLERVVPAIHAAQTPATLAALL